MESTNQREGPARLAPRVGRIRGQGTAKTRQPCGTDSGMGVRTTEGCEIHESPVDVPTRKTRGEEMRCRRRDKHVVSQPGRSRASLLGRRSRRRHLISPTKVALQHPTWGDVSLPPTRRESAAYPAAPRREAVTGSNRLVDKTGQSRSATVSPWVSQSLAHLGKLIETCM